MRDSTRLNIFGVTTIVCIYVEAAKMIGRRIKKNAMLAAYNRNLPSKRFSEVEVSALSIINPRMSAAETSIIPVIIEIIPEKTKTLKLPFNAHFKNPLRYLGGGPLDLAVGFIQFDGFID